MFTTLLKVYYKCGLFEKAKGLLTELEALGFAQDKAKHVVSRIKFVAFPFLPLIKCLCSQWFL
jgi:pentatricopeptide repeat protein